MEIYFIGDYEIYRFVCLFYGDELVYDIGGDLLFSCRWYFNLYGNLKGGCY